MRALPPRTELSTGQPSRRERGGERAEITGWLGGAAPPRRALPGKDHMEFAEGVGGAVAKLVGDVPACGRGEELVGREGDGGE